jgi:hypothetical protein
MIASLQDETTRTGAIEYMWEQLTRGKTLASLVLRSVTFHEGTIASLIPDSYGPLEISQFDRGHRIGRGERQMIKLGTVSGVAIPKVSVRGELAELICTLLNSESLCLLENPLAKVGDPWLSGAKSRLATHGTEIYHFLTASDGHVASVCEALLESSHSPSSWGALGRIPTDRSVSGRNRIALTTDELKRFAETVRCLFVSAYDGEGCIVWNGSRETE